MTQIHELKHREDLHIIGLKYSNELTTGILASIMEYRAKYEEYMNAYKIYGKNRKEINKIAYNMITKYDTSKLLENLISKDSRFTFGLIGIMHAYNDSNGNSNLCDAILSKFRGTEKILRETIKLYDINAMHLYEKYIDIVTKEDMIDYYQIQINS